MRLIINVNFLFFLCVHINWRVVIWMILFSAPDNQERKNCKTNLGEKALMLITNYIEHCIIKRLY